MPSISQLRGPVLGAAQSLRGPVLGAAQSLGVLGGFALLGLALGAGPRLLLPPPLADAPAAYAPASMSPCAPEERSPETWLVDGFNAIQVGLLRGRDRDDWWSGARRAELLDEARAFCAGEDPRTRVFVVFDGPHPAPEAPEDETGVRTVFAPSADAWLLTQVRSAVDPGAIRLVTADRRLAERARRRGARIVAPGEFLAACRARRAPEGSARAPAREDPGRA